MTKTCGLFLLGWVSANVLFSASGLASSVCSHLSVAPYQAEPEFDSRIDRIISHHSISGLAKQLSQEGVSLEFDLGSTFDIYESGPVGYVVQRRMLQRLLGRIFPLHSDHRVRIGIELLDSGMGHRSDDDWLGEETDPSHILQMSRAKIGNPQVFPESRASVRMRYGISEKLGVVSVYGDVVNVQSLDLLFHLLDQNPIAPQVVVLSPRILTLSDVMAWAQESNRDIRINLVSELADRPSIRVGTEKWAFHGIDLIYNDTRGRLPEWYAASDYALIVGANNIFEPLMVGCPTLIISGLLYSSMDYYSRTIWDRMKTVALGTGGAIDLDKVDPAQAFRMIAAVHRERILHPAFVVLSGQNKNGLEQLLDRLELMIRTQLRGSVLSRGP